MSNLRLVLVKSVEGAEHFVELQRIVWGSDPLDVVPNHVTVTVLKNGGALLGAYLDDGPAETGGMVGAAFWWLGVGPDLTLKVCSHMAGVLPAWQGQGIGSLLKRRQRELILEQGLTDWVTWTYDPLQRVNGVLNLRRLGGVCNTYYRNVYGVMHDALNAGSPTDRFQIDWRLRSPRVVAAVTGPKLAADQPSPLPSDIDAWQILPTTLSRHGLLQPLEATPALDGTPLAVPIPDDINQVRRHDRELGLAWRVYTREIFEAAFAQGYVAVDCLRLPDQSWYYVLRLPEPVIEDRAA